MDKKYTQTQPCWKMFLCQRKSSKSSVIQSPDDLPLDEEPKKGFRFLRRSVSYRENRKFQKREAIGNRRSSEPSKFTGPVSRSTITLLGLSEESTTLRPSFEQSIRGIDTLVKTERRLDWLSSFRRLDPRYQILKFFNDVARDGARNIEETHSKIKEEALSSPLLRAFAKASAFSVWRPTSNDAIRKMMTGEGSGKGLDVKGKSAKKGVLSGFIPFLQIHEEQHKNQVRWPPKDGMIRLYFKNVEARDKAETELTLVSNDMMATVSKAKDIIAQSSSNESALADILYDVADPKIYRLDHIPSRFGLIVAERTFFNVYISRQNITRTVEYETGRPSEPSFQDMNFACTRKYKGKGPRAVVLQTSKTVDFALSPQSLVIGYEENGSVIPVASDFDCFLVGTRNVLYESPLPEEQVKVLRWLLTQIESILSGPKSPRSWISRWLDVLKHSAEKGFYPEVPEYGFGDPKSYAIMEEAVSRLRMNGAVRHGAECFNYFFPQDLDEYFLVVDDALEGNVQWKYVDVHELQNILCKRIEEGFTFPLNPKWILADSGWKAVYDKMMASDDKSIQMSLAVWYPEESGIRELIEDIHTRFPEGFQKLNIGSGDEFSKAEGTEAMDLAEQQLRRHLILRRAKFKLRCALRIMKMQKQYQSK